MTVGELANLVRQARGQEISGFLADGQKCTLRLDLSDPRSPAWDCWVGNVLTPNHIHWQADTVDQLAMRGQEHYHLDILSPWAGKHA